MDTQLVIEVAQMRFDGPNAHHQRLSDVLIGESLTEQLENFGFPFR